MSKYINKSSKITHDYSRYYRHWHTSIEDASKHFLPYLRKLNLPLHARILDVGCGQGAFIKALATLGYKDAIGVDISEEQILMAEKNGVQCHQISSILEIPENSKKYDAIFLFDVLEHIPKIEQIETMNHLQKLLNDTGFIFIRVPNANAWFSGTSRWGDWTHTTSFSEHSLDYVLHNAGYSDIKINEDDYGILPLWVPRPSISGLLKSFFRIILRLIAIGEFGPSRGIKMPLTSNITAVASPDQSTRRSKKS